MHESPVNLGALNPSRREVRSREPCALCARFGWQREHVFLWPPTSTRDELCVILPPYTSAAGMVDPRGIIADHLSPKSYWSRWSFMRCDGTLGGIPLEELEASAVRDPSTGRLWLAHKKVFCEVYSPRFNCLV